MNNSIDIPPVPDCFSHLVVDDIMTNQEAGPQFSSSLGYQNTEAHDIAENDNSTFNRSYIIKDPTQEISNGEPVKIEELAKESLNLNVFVDSSTPSQVSTMGSFGKLNNAFRTLQKEMQDLRCLDINMFYQLASLHEQIQDAKMNFNDRYSETGSEYSMGTASYMGSMSSLNEDSDWAEEVSTVEDSTLKDSSENAIDLLKQISNLALRADADF